MQVSVKENGLIKQKHILIDAVIWGALVFVGMSSDIITLICTLILSCSFFLKSKKHIIADVLFFYPFYNIFKLGGVGVSLFNVVIVFAILALNMDGQRIKMLNTKISATSLAMLIYVLYTAMVSVISGSFSAIFSVVVDILIPMMLVYAVVREGHGANIRFLVYAFAIGVILAGLVGSNLIPVSGLELYVPRTYGIRVGGLRLDRFQGLTGNPNYYSLDVNMAIAMVLSIPTLMQQKFKKIEYVFLLLLLLVGIMTISKSFFLGLAVTFFFYLFSSRSIKQIWRSVGIILILCVVLIYLYVSGNEYLSAVLTRFESSDDSMSALTSSRSDIWGEYLGFMIKNPLLLIFGSGIQATPLNGHYTHNLYIESLYYIGIMGVCILTMFIVCLIRKGKKCGSNYIPLLTFLTRAFAINLLVREGFMIGIMLSLLILNFRKVENIFEEEKAYPYTWGN